MLRSIEKWRRVAVHLLATATVIAMAIGCAGAESGIGLKEVHRVRAGDLDVVVLSDDGSVAHDKDALTMEFRRSDGDLVDVGDVKGFATMPMAGLPPMMGSVFLSRTRTPGRYTAETDLSMAGGWTLTLEWAGAGGGKATIDTVAK